MSVDYEIQDFRAGLSYGMFRAKVQNKKVSEARLSVFDRRTKHKYQKILKKKNLMRRRENQKIRKNDVNF